MQVNELARCINLLVKLNKYITDGHDSQTKTLTTKDIKTLIELFPDYKYSGYAYRCIRGEWYQGFDNLSWSHYECGAREAYISMNTGQKSYMKMYMTRVSGFDLSRFVEEFSSQTGNKIFEKSAVDYARRENEILAYYIDESRLELVNNDNFEEEAT